MCKQTSPSNNQQAAPDIDVSSFTRDLYWRGELLRHLLSFSWLGIAVNHWTKRSRVRSTALPMNITECIYRYVQDRHRKQSVLHTGHAYEPGCHLWWTLWKESCTLGHLHILTICMPNAEWECPSHRKYTKVSLIHIFPVCDKHEHDSLWVFHSR